MFKKNDGAAQERLLTAEASDDEDVGAPSDPKRRSWSKHNCTLIALLSLSMVINVGLALAYSISKSRNTISVNEVDRQKPTLYCKSLPSLQLGELCAADQIYSSGSGCD